jgi:acetyl-CoA acetyltransferase
MSAGCTQRSKCIQMLRDLACIVGVGETAYTRGSQKSVLRLVLEASRHAMADAGVTIHDIDGFVLPGPYFFQEALAAHLGINDLRYSTYIQMGGASPVTALQSAAMVVAMGMATYVLVPFGWNGYSEARVSRRETPQAVLHPTENAMSRAVRNFYAPYGALAPVQYYAWLAHVTGRSMARPTNRWARWRWPAGRTRSTTPWPTCMAGL